VNLGLGIQAAVDSVHPCHCHQILGSCCQRRPRIDGVPRRFEQPFSSGCCRVRSVSSASHDVHAFTTDLQCLANSEIVEKFPQTICERLIQTLGEVKSGKVFRGVLWILGEYIESVSDIQSTLQEIRKVLGEIPILASEQRLLDEANGGEEPDGDASGMKDEKPKEGGGKPRVLADGTYATESAYTSTTTARLEAVKAAAKPPLRSTFPPFSELPYDY
jgi:vesicle coat complex subunit